MNSHTVVVDNSGSCDLSYPWLWNGESNLGDEGSNLEVFSNLSYVDCNVHKQDVMQVTNCETDQSTPQLLDIVCKNSQPSVNVKENSTSLENNVYFCTDAIISSESDDLYLLNDTNLFSVAANVEIDDSVEVLTEDDFDQKYSSGLQILDFPENQNESLCDNFSSLIGFEDQSLFPTDNSLSEIIEPSPPSVWPEYTDVVKNNVRAKVKCAKRFKPQQCPVCQRKFSYVKNFNRHLLKHKKENTGECKPLLPLTDNKLTNHSFRDVQVLIKPLELIFDSERLKHPVKLNSSNSFELFDKNHKDSSFSFENDKESHRSRNSSSSSASTDVFYMSDILNTQPAIQIEKITNNVIKKHLAKDSYKLFLNGHNKHMSDGCNLRNQKHDSHRWHESNYGRRTYFHKNRLEHQKRCSVEYESRHSLKMNGGEDDIVESISHNIHFSCSTSHIRETETLEVPNNERLKFRCMFCYQQFNKFIVFKSHIKKCSFPVHETLSIASKTYRNHLKGRPTLSTKSRRRRKKRCYEVVPFSLCGGIRMKMKTRTIIQKTIKAISYTANNFNTIKKPVSINCTELEKSENDVGRPERKANELIPVRKSHRRSSNYEKDFYFIMQHGRPRCLKRRSSSSKSSQDKFLDSHDEDGEAVSSLSSLTDNGNEQESEISNIVMSEEQLIKQYYKEKQNGRKCLNVVLNKTNEATVNGCVNSNPMIFADHVCSTSSLPLYITGIRSEIVHEKIVESCKNCRNIFKTFETVKYFNTQRNNEKINVIAHDIGHDSVTSSTAKQHDNLESSVNELHYNSEKTNDMNSEASARMISESVESQPSNNVLKRVRGRPRKNHVLLNKIPNQSEVLIKRPRGRPRKNIQSLNDNHRDVLQKEEGNDSSISSDLDGSCIPLAAYQVKKNNEKGKQQGKFVEDALNEKQNGGISDDYNAASTSDSLQHENSTIKDVEVKCYNLRNGQTARNKKLVKQLETLAKTQLPANNHKRPVKFNNTSIDQFKEVESENVIGKTRFYCPYCLKYFSYFFSWRCHVATQHGHQTVPCAFCNEHQPLCNRELEIHLHNHFEMNETYRPKLIQKLVRVLIQQEELPQLEQNGIFVCDCCKNIFTSKRALHKHSLKKSRHLKARSRRKNCNSVAQLCLKDSANIHIKRAFRCK